MSEHAQKRVAIGGVLVDIYLWRPDNGKTFVNFIAHDQANPALTAHTGAVQLKDETDPRSDIYGDSSYDQQESNVP